MEKELEDLRKEREEKVRQIAEKRKQVEELKRRRAERQAKEGGSTGGRRASGQLERSVDTLVAEILGGEAPAVGKVSAEGPLKELAGNAAARPHPGERSLRFETEYSVASITVDPAEANTYDRSCQTDLMGEDVGKKGAGGGEGGTGKPSLNRAPTSVLMKMAERARTRGVLPGAPGEKSSGPRAGKVVKPDIPQAAPIKEAPAEIKEMEAEEKDRIMKHPDFHAFFQRTSLLIERILGQETWDLAADFKTDAMTSEDAEGEGSNRMKFVDEYVEDRWSRNRPVTEVRCSPHQKEMFLAGYGTKVNPNLSDPDGCMLVWNLAMKTRPELAFTSPSAVLTANFHRFDKALMYGGTYSGGVVLWDARAKAGPVLRTPLSGKGHSHPVQAMHQTGTQNATNLVTASNDGRLCVWSLAMLNLPQETIDLKNETKQRRDLAVTTLSFPENETNILYVGAEDGTVCQVHIHGSKVGVTELYDGHEGPVAGIDMHPHQADASQHGADMSHDLALSCSFDWSVKLWMVKQHQSPVLSLDIFEDYVYDVKWHPTNPAVFASVDGEGHVDMWNLNRNVESPISRCDNANQPAGRKLAINRCNWSIDGRTLVSGDSEGSLAVYAVDRKLAAPGPDDFAQFKERMQSFQPIVPRARDGGYSGGGGASSLDAPRSYASSLPRAPSDARVPR